MKKLFVLILSLIFVLSLCIGTHAEEALAGEDYSGVGETIPKGTPEELPEDIHTGEPEENYDEVPDVPPSEDGVGSVSVDTILTRVLEWWELNKAEIMSVVGLVISGLFAAFGKHLANKITNLKKDTSEQITNSSKLSTDKTNELIDAYNKNAEAVELLSVKMDELAKKVAEVDKNTLDTEKIEINIARMLNAAFSRLKLPNGTKDVVNAEFAQIIDKGHVNASQEAVGDEDNKQD